MFSITFACETSVAPIPPGIIVIVPKIIDDAKANVVLAKVMGIVNIKNKISKRETSNSIDKIDRTATTIIDVVSLRTLNPLKNSSKIDLKRELILFGRGSLFRIKSDMEKNLLGAAISATNSMIIIIALSKQRIDV